MSNIYQVKVMLISWSSKLCREQVRHLVLQMSWHMKSRELVQDSPSWPGWYLTHQAMTCTVAFYHQIETVYNWAALECIRKLDEKVTQIPTIPTPTTLPCLSQPEPMVLWGVPYNQFTKEEKIQFSDSSAQYISTIWKWAAAAGQPISGTSLRTVKKSPPSEQNFK